MAQEFYTVKEVAAILRVSKKTVYDWMGTRNLPYVQAGMRKRLIPKEGLEEFKRRWAVGLDSGSYTEHDIAMPMSAAALPAS